MNKNYKLYGASEHKKSEDKSLPCEFYGYVCVEHDTLGTFYVSTGCFGKSDIRTDGKPWNFLRSKKYKLTDEQIDFVNSHKREISEARC